MCRLVPTTLACVIACIIGCDKSSTAPEKSAALAPARVILDLQDHPTTKADLRQRYTESYDAGDVETIRALIYWSDTPDAIIQAVEGFLIDRAGEYRVARFVDQPQFEGKLSEQPWTLKNGDMVEIVLAGDDGSNTFDWAIGSVDGKFYFASLSPKKE